MTSLTTISSMATISNIPPVNSERSPSSDNPQVQSASSTSNTARRDEIAQSISNLTSHLNKKKIEAETLRVGFENGSNDNTVEGNDRWKREKNLDAINLFESVGELVQETKKLIGQVQKDEAKTFEDQLRDLGKNVIDTNSKALEVAVKVLGSDPRVLQISNATSSNSLAVNSPQKTAAERSARWEAETEAQNKTENDLKAEAESLGIKLWELTFQKSMRKLPKDSLSNSKPDEAVITHLVWDVEPDFAKKQFVATATYEYSNKAIMDNNETLTHDNMFKGHETLTLDFSDLEIEYIEVNGHRVKIDFKLSNTPNKPDALLIPIPPGSDRGKVAIKYRTRETSPGVYWIDKEHTEGKQHPQVYTLFKETEGASVIPGQHSPQVLLTYEVKVNTKSSDLMALSSVTNNPTERTDGKYKDLIMERKVPLCLLSLNVGNFTFKKSEKDSRIGVYAEQASANALAWLPEFMRAAEEICGPYTWGSYTPVVVSGRVPDMVEAHPCASTWSRACLDNPFLMARDLFRSWAGSGIPIAVWNQSFLSEGLTTYLMYQIAEKTWGSDYASMLFLTTLREMKRDFQVLGETFPDVLKLCQQTDERKNTRIPSGKGALFFFMLEQAFCKTLGIDGKKEFYRFLKDYMRVFDQVCTSKDRFEDFLKNWLQIEKNVNFLKFTNENHWWDWLYGTEIPKNAPIFNSKLVKDFDAERQKLTDGQPVDEKKILLWDVATRSHFLVFLDDLSPNHLKMLDAQLRFSDEKNMSIREEWTRLCAKVGYITSE